MAHKKYCHEGNVFGIIITGSSTYAILVDRQVPRVRFRLLVIPPNSQSCFKVGPQTYRCNFLLHNNPISFLLI